MGQHASKPAAEGATPAPAPKAAAVPTAAAGPAWVLKLEASHPWTVYLFGVLTVLLNVATLALQLFPPTAPYAKVANFTLHLIE